MTGGRRAETERRNIFARTSTPNVWRNGDVCFAVGSHSNRKNSGGTLYRIVADGIGDGPPSKIGFGTNNSQMYGIKFYKSGSTEVCSKELKRH